MMTSPLDSYFEDPERHEREDITPTRDLPESLARSFLPGLCEATLARAVSTRLGGEGSFTSVELHLHYLRPLPAAAGPLRCVAEGVRVGARTATAIARVLGAGGVVYAHASMTCLLHLQPAIDSGSREGSQP